MTHLQVDDIRNAMNLHYEQYTHVIESLKKHGCEQLVEREEYILFREVVTSNSLTEVLNSRQVGESENTVNTRLCSSGVNSYICRAIGGNDTTFKDTSDYIKSFLAPFDIQKAGSIAEVIPSYKVIQSQRMYLNIGFDTENKSYKVGEKVFSRVFSLQMSVMIGDTFIRYFFLISPSHQVVTVDGGAIPLKYCLADILFDLKKIYSPELPLVRKEKLVFKEVYHKAGNMFKSVDFKEMKESVIPVTLICHTGKVDISVFRRSKYDIDIVRKCAEIQGGWMSTEDIRLKVENDKNYNNYWLINLSVRDTLGLTPADNKSLKELGKLIGKNKIELPKDVIKNMDTYLLTNPVDYYEYAMNDADIVVAFCSELFQRNHAVPMTLSSAAAKAMRESIKEYFGITKKSDYDKMYRGLELLDEGIMRLPDECMKFLKATRYVPLRENPDAKLVTEYFEESYTGGFNACFYPGWITEYTTDFDLQNAYPTAMANIIDIDWSKNVRDYPRNYEMSLQDIASPLIPTVVIGDFDFPDNCYCPNIPVPVPGGMKIYPRHGKNVYMSGPDIYLALKLGAKIKIYRGFTCQMLIKDDKPSQCLAYAVSNLVQDRMRAKKVYKDNPLIEKSLKAMVVSCYGKTAQNVSPKTRYNASVMGRLDAEPSSVTSPYHATYTTALVRCMLIACINELHDMGYRVYSVTTDGFITNAPEDVVRSLNAHGFGPIFQKGRYILNQTCEDCDANHVWEIKHINEVFLNISTRGNVAVNDEGVIAHNSFTTGEIKGSRADRDSYITQVLDRNGKLKCHTNMWTKFADMVEKRNPFQITEIDRYISMNFDYKRCPIVETAIDTPVHYESRDGEQVIDTEIAKYDTRPFNEVEEFLNYRKTMKNEDCVKVVADLERVKVKSTVNTKGYIGKDLKRKVLLSILMGYRAGIYQIPALDGLKQSEVVQEVNTWGIAEITVNDWKNCSRLKRQENMLPYDVLEETLQKIYTYSNSGVK